MNKLERILVPVDFSENSAMAVRHAGDLARHFHSEITLLYVNELVVTHAMSGPLGYGISSWEATRAEHLARRQKELEEFGGAELQGISVKRLMRCGDPAQVIAQHAQAGRTDLIFMPTHGYGIFRRMLLGSVTAKVLHDAECPVWTGTHLAEASTLAPSEVRHVICAVNFGPQSKRALRWASDFASAFGAKLTAMYAVPTSPANLPERYTYQWHDEARWGAEEMLRCLLLDMKIDADALIVQCGVECSLVEGSLGDDLPTALGEAARKADAGLLVIGRSCKPGRAGRLGSDAYGIICHAPCPVVSI